MWARRRDHDAADLRPLEFWQEEEANIRAEMRRHILHWFILLIVLFSVTWFVAWWASSSIHFSASRVEATTKATWRVFGVIRDDATGEPVTFARIADSPKGRPPRFEASADHLGHYELMTVAEPHEIIVLAFGYQPLRLEIGRPWYRWMPEGGERCDVRLRRKAQ
jgi:hypothetical protein